METKIAYLVEDCWHVIPGGRVRVRCSEVSSGIRNTGLGEDWVPRGATVPDTASPNTKKAPNLAAMGSISQNSRQRKIT